MKNVLKRTAALLFALVLVIALVPVTAQAYTFSQDAVIYFQTDWNAPVIQLMIGHDRWSEGFPMYKAAGTSDIYYFTTIYWEGATQVAAIGADARWEGKEENIPQRIGGTDKATNVVNVTGDLSAGAEYVLTNSGLSPVNTKFTFHANGGSGTMAAETSNKLAYTLPTQCGFTAPANKKFAGWSTSENGEVITSIKTLTDTDLYAQWETDFANVEVMWGSSKNNLTEGGTFEEAITAANESADVAYIQLQKDVYYNPSPKQTLTAKNSNLVIDWNGNDFTVPVMGFHIKSKLTLQDTAATPGKVSSTMTGGIIFHVWDNGDLEILSGNYDARADVVMLTHAYTAGPGSATCTIRGGSFNSKSRAITNTAGTLIVEGGSFTAGSISAICAGSDSRKTVIRGGTFNGTPAIDFRGGKLEFSGSFPHNITVESFSNATVASKVTMPENCSVLLDGAPVTEMKSGNIYTIGITPWTITRETVTNGTITVPSYAQKGETITVTATPAEGYVVKSIMYTPDGMSKVVGTPVNNQFSFVMPEANVTVSAEFKSVDVLWGTSKDNLTEGGTFSEAIAAANNDSSITYIQLQKDVTYNPVSTETIRKSGELTIDWNGHDFTATCGFIMKTDLTLQDTAATPGTVKITTAGAALVDVQGGTLDILSGNYRSESTAMIAYTNGWVSSTLIYGGTFVGDSSPIYAYTGFTIIYGGTFTGGAEGAIKTGDFRPQVYIRGGNFTSLPAIGYHSMGDAELRFEDDFPVGITVKVISGYPVNIADQMMFPYGYGLLLDGKGATETEVGKTYEVNMVPYTITCEPAENGTISAPATGKYEETIHVTVIPAEGYELATIHYNGNGTIFGIENPYTFRMPERDVTITATFRKHVHDWRHQVDDDSCTATCGCGAVELVRIEAPDIANGEVEAALYDFDGNPGTTTCGDYTAGEITYIGIDGTDYESTTAPTNAGKYSATVKLESPTGAPLTIHADYEIPKKQPIAPTGLEATYGDTLEDVILPAGWTWDAPTTDVGNAGTKTFKASYAGDPNTEAATAVDVTVTVNKAQQEAPVLTPVNETVETKADGKIIGLTTEMEIATKANAADSEYTKVTDPDMTFAPGTYYVRYYETDNYLPSAATTVEIGEGLNVGITWIIDGEEDYEDLAPGDAITAPADPTKEGHTFLGWEGDEIPATIPAEDITITLKSTWEKNSYKLTWVIDGETTEETVPYGDSIKAPANPTKEGYKFLGWEGDEIPATMPAKDITITLKSVWEKLPVQEDNKNDDPNVPVTADPSQMVLWTVLCITSMLGMAVMLMMFPRKKGKYEVE